MTYAIVACGRCGRHRMIDRSSPTSACPFCSRTEANKGLRAIFEDADQNAVREALRSMHPVEAPEKRRQGADPDPLSTLMYRYESCVDLQERMALLARGLTDIYGTFTLEDVERIDERNAEKLLRAMLETCLVHEVRHGLYSA
ncbi:MAG: hypothetical protein FWH47_00220 [Methanomassiliicoccaceae archaeon]|nr:hypothetical protein [Methanomassiliicoccaceae archaeon]